MEHVLVLNASWEPMSHTRLARAVALVLKGAAVVHETVEGRVLRHANGFMPYPRVIRRVKYLKMRDRTTHRPATWSRRGVLVRDNYLCAYCGKAATSVDHIVPVSRGGANTWLNTVACCTKCNNKKDSKTLAELGWKLRITPWQPTRWQLLHERRTTGGS